MSKLLYLFLAIIMIILSSLVIEPFIKNYLQEGYSNYKGALVGTRDYPGVVDKPLLGTSFPLIGKNNVSDNNYSDIWWHYPIFKVGSYAQVTNNLQYQRNPDDGKCSTAEFCGALYKDNEIHTNVSHPLPPVPDTPGTRVGYYRTPDDLFLGSQPGPLLELPAFTS